MSNDELEEIRQKKLAEMQAQASAEQQRQDQQQKVDETKAHLLRGILEPAARDRLANIRLVKPETTEAIEMQLIQLVQSGRVNRKITDDELRMMLSRMQKNKKRDTKITFR